MPFELVFLKKSIYLCTSYCQKQTIMRKLMTLLVGLTMAFSLTSCVTTVHAQDDSYFDGEVDASVVITYGTPFIVDNMVEYYIYRGWYYYPYWVNDSYYFHRYRRPLPPERFHDWYRPIPRNYHHPRPSVHHNNHHSPRPDVRHRPHNSRPSHMPSQASRRPSNNIGTHAGRPHGNMGGRPSSGHRGGTRMGGRR